MIYIKKLFANLGKFKKLRSENLMIFALKKLIFIKFATVVKI